MKQLSAIPVQGKHCFMSVLSVTSFVNQKFELAKTSIMLSKTSSRSFCHDSDLRKSSM